jgi:tetratricopeptide (TPR) repeat protein
VRLNLALAYYKRADLDDAVRTLKQVRLEQPGNMQAATLLADSYLQLAQNKNVITLLTPLQQAHPDDRSFDYLLGTALVRDGQTAKGQVVIDKILRDGDSAEARLLMGTTKYMVTDFSGARDDFQKAIQLNDKLPDAYAYYGLALLATGDQAGAKDAFTHELQTNPNNFESNLHLGVLYRNDEDYDHALKYLNHALVVRPGDPGVRYQIASIKFSQGQLADSQRDLESLLKDSPNFIEAHVTLATVYFREKRTGDGNRARAIFAKLNAARRDKAEIAAQPAQ